MSVRSILFLRWFVCLFEIRHFCATKKQTKSKSKSFELLSIHLKMITNECRFDFVYVVVGVLAVRTCACQVDWVHQTELRKENGQLTNYVSFTISNLLKMKENNFYFASFSCTPTLFLCLSLLQFVNISLFSLISGSCTLAQCSSICLHRRCNATLLDILRESKAKICYLQVLAVDFLGKDLLMPWASQPSFEQLKNFGIALIKLKFLVIVIELYR